MKLAFRLFVVAVVICAFVSVVGSDRVEAGIGATVHAIANAPEHYHHWRAKWHKAEKKADRARRKADRP
jgi:hypothetical protein